MTRKDENMNQANPEAQLDRLVDGELSEDDRRSLLLQLDHEPEGWRRCALAFLEAQCWKQELGLMARTPSKAEAASEPAVPAAPAARWSAWRRQLATVLSMAACFLIALALVIGLRGGVAGSGHGPGSPVREVTNEFPLNPSAQAQDKYEFVKVSADSPNGPTETLNIPAVRRDSFDRSMLERFPAAIPPDVQRTLEQAGYQIRQDREVVPVQMNNGERLMVPVNNVEIHYVGRGS
jgi:hypothetical protein